MSDKAKDREQNLIKDIFDYDYQMKDEKTFYEPVLQDIIDNLLTNQPSVNLDSVRGKDRSTKIYDGTPRSALNVFTNGIYGLMVSPNMRWFKLEMEDEGLDDIDEVKIWLNDTEERLYKAFRKSNFYGQMKSYLRDGGSLGTACMYSEEDILTGKTFYTTLPIREYRIAENRHKVVDRLHREFELTARQIKEMFGEENLTGPMKTALGKENQRQRLQRFRILHAVFPRKDAPVGLVNSKNKPCASVWIALGQTDQKSDISYRGERKILRESGYDEFPYAIWRFDQETNEIYGRSPAWDNLAEIKGAHVMERDLTKAGELSVNAPMNVHVNQKGNFKRIPGGINYFKDPDEKADVVDLGIDFPIGLEQQDRKRATIKEGWFVDFFLLITSRDTTMTATEVLELQGEKISILAPVITSLSQQALNPIVDRQFNIEYKAGRLSQPPQILQGRQININYIGPLAQAQQRAFETQGLSKSIEVIRPVLEFRPEVADNFDWDGIARDTTVASGLPAKYLRSEDMRDDIRDQRVEEAEKEAQMIAAESGATNLKNIALAEKASGGKISKQLAGNA